MRLDATEIAAITATAARVFGPDASVRLFGSRTDDARRGGDIDLYIEVAPGMADLGHQSRFSWDLQGLIGEQKIDVLVHERGTPLRPMHRIAERTGLLLGPPGPAGAASERKPAMEKADPAAALAAALNKCNSIAVRLRKAQHDIGHWFPMSGHRLSGLDDFGADRVEALLKRVENLQDLLARSVFRALLILQGEDVVPLLARDVFNIMEKIEVIESTKQWLDLSKLRHQLAHDYPLDEDEAVGRVNDAFAAIDPLVETLERVKDYVARKSWLNEAG